MTEDCGGNTVATSTTPLSWWYLQANSLSTWNDSNKHAWNSQINPNSSSSCDEDISVSSTSFTNASNHSSLTVESSRRLVEPPHAPSSSNEFMREHASDNQLWSHVLSGVGSNGELHNSQEIGENFLDALSSKNMASAMFEPACDYLKKLDTSWDYSGSTSFNSFEKHLNGFSEALIENNERLTKLSNLVSTWSIAPPEPEVSSHQLDPQTNNMSLNSSMDHHHYPQPFGDSSSCSIEGVNSKDSSGMFPFYDQEMKVKQEYHHASEAVLGKSFNANGYQNGLNSLSVGDNSGKFYHGFPNLSPCTRNSSDVISFNNRLGRPVNVGIHAQRPNMKYSNLSESKKQGLQTPSQMRTNNGRGEGTIREVKKKRSEESSEAISKKPKQDTSTASSSKAPKVKLADKITALQQIVSPFGKTDTASVLFEAIGYIKFLQEQVQLLSNPYLKTNLHKDPRGSFDRKDKEDAKLDLRSKGLCLVPTSCTPVVYRENTGPDYWTPAYRGCLYR
ncbi:transcription factor bHLH111 isoform X2 [Lotus japonicus]|uniref:transcription factor bHLH111 isoform X2 n=1 Tax=Lotus japonicus TaxID=34305 RepID=UPI00258A6F0A|nr:transcription factor bHLH111 isoform X2 [Lotus japonicus]